MLSKFQSLAASIDSGTDGEKKLRDAIQSALDQLDD
jgi:hypothetical protein